MLFEASITVEQDVIAAAITIARASYTVFIRFGCAPTQHEAEQRLCSEALTSDVGLQQNFGSYKKWIPLSSNF